jgi:hypothetical protein
LFILVAQRKLHGIYQRSGWKKHEARVSDTMKKIPIRPMD